MKCPRCDATVDANQKFCKGCGKQLKKLKCKKCGQPLSIGDNFCGECGQKGKFINEKILVFTC